MVKPDVLRLEARNAVTPMGAASLGLSTLGLMHAFGGGNALTGSPSLGSAPRSLAGRTEPLDPAGLQTLDAAGDRLAIRIVPEAPGGQGSGGALPDVPSPSPVQRESPDSADDPTVGLLGRTEGSQQATQPSGLSAPWKPASQLGAGGGALPPRGGSGSVAAGVAIATAKSAATTTPAAPNPTSSSSSAASSALLSTLGLSAGASQGGTTVSRNALAAALNSKAGPGAIHPGDGATPLTSPAFTLLTLDYNQGTVMVPGFDQLATPGGAVDLRAEVVDSNAGTYTYSWNTTGLTDATGISGSSSYDLTFHWDTTISTANSESVTLTVTDPDSNQVSQTYTFWVPAGSDSTTGGTTWASSLDPGAIAASSPAVSSDNVSVVSATGALAAAIDMPSYNPNVPALSLTYNSLAANAMPIVVAEHPLSASSATPSKVSAQLTFDGTALTTYYYNTSSLTPGDIMQIGLQATNATSLDSGSYPYTMTVADDRSGSWTTVTYDGTATVENAAKDPTFSALGAGWTVDGLMKIIPGTGGVLLDEGGGSVLWYSGSFGGGGGTYTSPAGDFSTLVLNSNGTYTRTLTDGTQQNFASTGLETTSVDRNGLTTTFTYSGNLLTKITDPFGQVTSFTYSSGYLQTIKDPANRLTTFTMSGGDLTAVEYPDDSTWDYGYDGSGRMTSVTEPSSAGEPTKITTITYDSAERVGTITRPDSTTEEFSAGQEQGWTDSGTSGSPAPSTLLAQVGSTYTDPLDNVTTNRPDWYGLGQTSQMTDALGNVTTYDLNSNGLATVTIDPMNRITQAAYDSKGNVTEITNPDGSTVTYGTYNSFAEPSSMTDELGRITTYTYDAHGNLTVKEDPMEYVTTYTYSATQPGMLISQTAPAPVGDSSYTLTSYQYDSYDRLTTITNADNDVTVNVYSSAGQVTKTTDPNDNVTTYSYDAMNRKTGETDAEGSAVAGISTYTYDAAGNQVTLTDPDNDTTTTTYDAMDRELTVKTPDGGVTTYVYDNDGRLYVLIDPVGNHTTFLYDSLGRQTTQVSPSVNSGSGETSTTEYDADGEVIETTDADGRVITYSYDSRGDQTGESWLSSGSAIYIATYTYDSAQEMTGAADNNSLLTMAYDSDGWLGTLTTSGPGSGQPTVTLTYSYDPDGDVTSITDSLSGSGDSGQGITSYVYDPALRLTTITQSFGGTAGPQIAETYDPGGRVTEVDRWVSGGSTEVNTTYGYDAANDMTAVNNYSQSRTPGIGLKYDVTQAYDPGGQVTSMVIDNGGSNTTTTYSYDPSGQVTGSTGGSNDTYAYDLNGNPNSTGYSTGAGNELTTSPGVTYTYDNNGNLVTAKTSSVTTTYTYDYENRLTSVDQNGTVIATYTYNALGQRIAIDDSGTKTWTVYNGTSADANPYADFTSSGTVSVRYLFGPAVDQILARTGSSGTTAWYLTDQLGSVRFIENTSGTVLDAITYDAFGNITNQTDSSYADRFMFAGMQFDATVGNYYDHARYYDAAIDRFMSQDPKGFDAGDTNVYRYVENDPTTLTDPSGLQDKPPGDGFVGDLLYYRWYGGPNGEPGWYFLPDGSNNSGRMHTTPNRRGGPITGSIIDHSQDGPPLVPMPPIQVSPEPPIEQHPSLTSPQINIKLRITPPAILKPSWWDVPPGQNPNYLPE